MPRKAAAKTATHRPESAAPRKGAPKPARRASPAKAEHRAGHGRGEISEFKSIKDDILRHIISMLGSDQSLASKYDVYRGLAYTIRERLAEKWIKTQRSYYERHVKRVYYLSLEFLVGKSLKNNILALGLEKEVERALGHFGHGLDEIAEVEWDAGLGNGGLGRLSACYLDSMANLALPAYGYGIRYDYGIFYQVIQDGWQVEQPDNWSRGGTPWEFERRQHLYPVQFYGEVRAYTDALGRHRLEWVGDENVMAMGNDMMVPGYHTGHVINMRLWAAKSSREFDLDFFNNGEYIKAIENKAKSENISKVLYPNDIVAEGQELRLKQQYFFVSATFQDIMRRHRKYHETFENLADLVAVQLNDTHPAIAIPELMRLLVDVELLGWDKAFDICVRVFAYTNHTVMPEALEHWSVDLMTHVLPRHMQIIYEINQRFLAAVRERFPNEEARVRRMSLISEDYGRRVRMANLAIVGSHSVNGVSNLHTQILKRELFRDFHEMFPERFNNKTNGVTPRRWLLQSNPGLAELISSRIGRKWITDLSRLKELVPLAKDAEFRKAWMEVKRRNKKRLADYIWQKVQVRLPLDMLFDVQVKRIHEYKRQLLNVLHVITLYNRIRDNRPGLHVPRAVIFGGKAAPGYRVAKLIIKLITSVAETVNRDRSAESLLKVIFTPNYCVSNAEKIIPGTDLSEQLSLAGTEASGTGNMKFALNGALTIGTLDGANVEIREEVGRQNIFIFGLTAQEARAIRAKGYDPNQYYHADNELKAALDMIAGGVFSPTQPDLFRPIIESLLVHGDRYMVLADYRSYMDCQEQVSKLWLREAKWAEKSILNTANMGKFSSDRAVAEYARDIWGVQTLKG